MEFGAHVLVTENVLFESFFFKFISLRIWILTRKLSHMTNIIFCGKFTKTIIAGVKDKVDPCSHTQTKT